MTSPSLLFRNLIAIHIIRAFSPFSSFLFPLFLSLSSLPPSPFTFKYRFSFVLPLALQAPPVLPSFLLLCFCFQQHGLKTMIVLFETGGKWERLCNINFFRKWKALSTNILTKFVFAILKHIMIIKIVVNTKLEIKNYDFLAKNNFTFILNLVHGNNGNHKWWDSLIYNKLGYQKKARWSQDCGAVSKHTSGNLSGYCRGHCNTVAM